MMVDYAFYRDVFHGRKAVEEFERLGVQAGAYIDEITFGRAQDTVGELRRRVMLAECAAVDALAVEEQGGAITSETAGSWTRSFAVDARSRSQRLYDAASRYLAGTGLMYPGV